MKHHSLFTLVLSFLSTLWMVSCTLIDNDLRELHDMPGYDNVVHIEDENMTCDYQYQDNTIVMDQRYEPYIHRMDYENHKLYMYDYTPEEMLPKVGQPLISPQNAKLEWGIMHTPTKITREGNLYVFELERTTIDNAFKVFDLDGEWDIMKETEYDVNLDDTTYTEVSNHARTTRASDGFENYDGDWHEVDILPIVGVIAGLAIVDENKRDQVADKALLSLGANWNFTWPRNVERDKETGRLKKGKDGFAVAVSATGSFRIRWKTLCKVKKILKRDGHKVEVVANVGSQIEIIPQITGKLELTADFFNILKLPYPKFGPLPGPLPVYVIFEPSFDFSVSLEGTVGYKWTKTFRTEFAAYNNISGKKDGVSVKNDNKPIKKEAMNEINKWSGNSEANLKINMEAGAGLTTRVVFGSPEEYPNVGLSLGFHFGARFKTVLDKNQSAYDNHIRFSLPLKLSGKFFLNIWDGFTFDWNFADAIAKL